MLFDVSGSMEGHMPNAREAAQHVLSWLDARATKRRSSPSTRGSIERTPISRSGLKTLPNIMIQRRAVRRDVAARRDRADGEASRRARRTPARGRGVHRRRRQRQQAASRRRLRQVASGIDVPVYIFGIVPSIDNPAAETALTPEKSALAGPLAGSRDGDRWALRSWQARRVSGALRRGKSSTSCGINISSRSNRAAHRAGIRSWSVRKQKDLVVRARNGYIAGQLRPIGLGGSDHAAETFLRCSRHGAGHRWVDGLRHRRSSCAPASAK